MTHLSASTENPNAPQEPVRHYVYFVAYVYQGLTPNSFGHGNNSVTRTQPIISYDDIADIQEGLKAHRKDASSVVIQNWKLLQIKEIHPDGTTVETSAPLD